jgi:aminopeptidase N
MKNIAVVVLLLVGTFSTAQRLPETAVPEHYQLSFAPDFQKNTFGGDETIRVRVLKSTPTITLNSAEITFQTVTVAQGSSTQTAKVMADPKQEMATFMVVKPLAAGEATIHIVYSGILNDQMRGLYICKSDKRKYATTQFEATDARRAFPSFDEPDEKATFEVTAIVDASKRAVWLKDHHAPKAKGRTMEVRARSTVWVLQAHPRTTGVVASRPLSKQDRTNA